MRNVEFVLVSLSMVTSLACMVLLLRAYFSGRSRLLLWSALCFVFLSINGVVLFVDLVVLPDVDLRIPRLLTALAGIVCLLYGFIWEAE